MKIKLKKKNIFIIFWNLGIGGIQRKVVDLTNYCSSGKYKNYRFHILLRDRTAFRMDNQINRTTAKIYYRPQYFNGKIHIPFTLYMLWKAYHLKPVTLLTFLDYTSFLSIIVVKILFWRNIRIVLNEDILTSPYVKSTLKRYLIKLFYPIADKIISPTLASKNDLVNNFSIPENKITVVPNWTLMFSRKKRQKPVFDLLYAGRFDEQKNLLFLLQVIKNLIKKLPEIKTCFIGDGTQRIQMQKFVKDNHLSQNVLLKKGIYNMSPYFQKVKIFTMSSLYEGMPVVLLEAMAAKKPVVVTRFPGVDEYLINKKTAFIENDIESYSKRIIDLLESDRLRNKIGNNAYMDIRKNFSEKPINEYISILMGKQDS